MSFLPIEELKMLPIVNNNLFDFVFYAIIVIYYLRQIRIKPKFYRPHPIINLIQ